MLKARFLAALVGSLTATALLASTVLADQLPVGSAGPPRPGNTFNVGDSMNVSIGPQQAAGELFHINYPGNSLPVVINARIDGLDNTLLNTAGFDVYDDENGTTPVEHLTVATNELNGDPHLMMFAFSAGKAQTVTVQFFNWSQQPLTLAVMPVQLPSVPLIQVGPTVPGSANAIGVSGVAGVTIGH